MNYQNSITIITVSIFLGALSINCSGDDGATGPMGNDGNANVIASGWIPEEFADFEVGTTVFYVEDEIFTQDILDSAVILVYAKDNNGEVVQLPFVSGNESYYYSILGTLGEIGFVARIVDGINNETFELFTHVRYIIIPDTIESSSRQELFHDTDKKTYQQIVKLHGLSY